MENEVTNVFTEPSILLTIKKLLGMDKDYNAFDIDIIIHINTVMTILYQMGVGPEGGFSITGTDETWDQYILEDNPNRVQSIKTYIYIKVKIMFDPPTVSAVLESLKAIAKELEVRLYTEKGGY